MKSFFLTSLFLVFSRVDTKTPTQVVLEEWKGDQLMCPGVNDRFLTFVNVPWNVPGRAYLTTPPEVEIQPSPLHGLGVVARTFIPKHTWLAEYDGETVLPVDFNYISWYAWTSWKGHRVQRYVDGEFLETSNWLRFVNTPRNVFEENVRPRDCRDKIYYMTSRDVLPGEELLISYGHTYLKTLGLWEEYTLSMSIRNLARKVTTTRNVRKVFNQIRQLMYSNKAAETSAPRQARNLTAVITEDRDRVIRIMGNKLFTSLSKTLSL